MPRQNLLPRGNFAPGTYVSPSIPPPPAFARGQGVAVLDDVRVTTPGLRLTLTTEYSEDHGTTWKPISSALWDSGPANTPHAIGFPTPRPGSGAAPPVPRSTKLRSSVVITLSDGTTSVSLGIDHVSET